MKKNRLYTVSSWNKPAFMQGNVFWPGGSLTLRDQGNFFQHQGGGLYGDTTGDNSRRYMAPVQGISPTDTINVLQNDSIKKALAFKPQIKTDTSKPQAVTIKPSTMQAVGMGLSAIGDIPTGDRRGLWDTLDPVYHLAGGRESGVGNTMSDVGIGLTKAGLQSGNVPLMIAGAGAKIFGGLTNAAFGIKTDKEKLAAANKSINANRNFVSNASSFDNVTGPAARVNTNGVFSGGWFSKGKAKDKQEELDADALNAYLFADRSVQNNINNLVNDQTSEALRNYSAFGGPLDVVENNNDMSAINYGFMQDYLLNKKREVAAKNKMSGMTSLPAFMPNSFAIGGDLQMNGADFSDGLITIGAGGSHETNPNEGIQIGKDNEGTPNLVEEGETIWNDYVFSARIPIDQATKEMFHIGKKREMTYADLSKKLEKEIAERVNDPISKAGFEKQMEMLEEQQERQKQEMEAERAKAAFEALSPEEQTALMQQRAEQEAMAQQAIAEQQAAMQSTEQPTPEEVAMAQQQQTMADGSEPNLGQIGETHYIDDGAVAMANGGKINRFDSGGKRNSGKFKNEKADNWGIFTRPGLEAFIESYRNRLNMAETEEQKKAIRKEAMDEFNAIQKGYADIYQDSSSGNFEYSDAVKKHQMNFDRAKGNTGFYSRDDAGNMKNLIAEAIDMPKGHATDDKPDSWYDGYWGPRTSIRNFGSTAYGNDDYYKPLVDAFRELGLTYAPNAEWKHGDNMLYGLSMAEAPTTERPADWTPEWQGGNPQAQVVTTPSPSQPSIAGTSTAKTEESGTAPRHKASWMRYAGIFGPAVGLGMQALGIGRPDTASIDAAISGAGNVTTASWKPIGNYLTYRPMDIWYQQNALNAQSRATDRQLVNNSSGNRGTAMAGLLANGYNSQIASGNLYRQALEYNDNLRKQVEEFNRGTNQFNAEAYNRNSQFNADAYNRARQANAQMKLHAAAQKANMDAGWNQGIYGNVAGLFKGLSDIGRENEQFNWLSDLAADGVFGNLGKSNTSKRWTKDKKSKGGKIKKRGLTI